MKFDWDHNEDVVLVGVKNSGKSEALKYIVAHYHRQGITVVVYDSEKEFDYPIWTLKDPLYVGSLVRYVPEYAKEPERTEEFDKVCGYIYDRRNIVFAVESIDFYTRPKKDLSENFSALVQWGRKRGHGLILTTRRCAEVNKSAIGSGSVHWLIFRTFLPNDIKWLKSFVGDTADDLKNMQNWHFIYWHFGTVETCKPLTIQNGEEEDGKKEIS